MTTVFRISGQPRCTVVVRDKKMVIWIWHILPAANEQEQHGKKDKCEVNQF